MSNRTELEQKYADLLKESDFTVKSIMHVNQQPHPYMIGPRHIHYASDHHGGMLSEYAIKEGEKKGKCSCAHPRCNIPYEEHTKGDHVLFLQLRKELTKEVAQEQLLAIKSEMEADAIDGLTFVDTEEKYRII